MQPSQRNRASRPRSLGRVGLCLLVALGLGTLVAVSEQASQELSRPIETDQDKVASDAEKRGGEVLRLHWKLSGFLGMLAGLFVPSNGDALLTFVPTTEDRVEIGVLVTAPKREGEYFVYGAEIDKSSGTTSAVWSSYAYGKSGRDREQRVDADDVIDYASAIYHLRWNPPETTTRMTIWDMGKTYPVEVEPLKPRMRNIGGEKVLARGYEIRGVKIKGEPNFDDKFFLYFADDSRSTPVEIVGKRSLIKVRFHLVDRNGTPDQPQRAASSK